MVGESVIAIGNAFGYVHTSTQGIISALHRDVPVNETQDYQDLIQISAGINPGNSGGPLLNIDGEIIGVNVAVRVGAQQIAFAIPIDQVVEIVTEMIEQHNDNRLATGLRTSGGPRDGDGVTIANVSASSPAAREGLKPGDRVVRVGSQVVDDRLDFALMLLNAYPGEPLDISVERDGQRYDLAVKTEATRRKRFGIDCRSGLDGDWRPSKTGCRVDNASPEFANANQVSRRTLHHRGATWIGSRPARDLSRRRAAGYPRLANFNHEGPGWNLGASRYAAWPPRQVLPRSTGTNLVWSHAAGSSTRRHESVR